MVVVDVEYVYFLGCCTIVVEACIVFEGERAPVIFLPCVNGEPSESC